MATFAALRRLRPQSRICLRRPHQLHVSNISRRFVSFHKPRASGFFRTPRETRWRQPRHALLGWALACAVGMFAAFGDEEKDDAEETSRTEESGTLKADLTAELNFQLEELDVPEISEPKYLHPQHEGLTIVVADSLEELCIGAKQGLLLDLYSQHCHACAAFGPIYRQVAAALAPEDAVRVGVMDGDLNYKKGFFTDEDLYAFPTVKYFPPGTTDPLKAIPYSGRKHAADLLRFVHEQDPTLFDLQTALARLEQSQERTKKAVIKQIRKNFSGGAFETSHNAPCGRLMMELIVHSQLLPIYCEPNDQDREKADGILARYQKCQKDSEADIQRYWEQVHDMAGNFVKRHNVTETDIDSQ